MNTHLLITVLVGVMLTSHVGSRIISDDSSSLYSVLDYGAVGDGSTDDSQAFMHTWETMCNSTPSSSPTMVIPGGKSYLIRPVSFIGGPCENKTIYIQFGGEILGFKNPNYWNCDGNTCNSLINFRGLKAGLDVSGGGTINGQGDKWWENLDIYKPAAMQIEGSNNVNITDLNFEDNPKMHLIIARSETVNVKNVIISAPENSPNTDGIHITGSTNVTVDNSIIGTGDDCISIVNGSTNVIVRNISCGPGHGISIGSLGKNGSYNTVEHIEISNVTFTNTMNGARIKTWQGGSGYARNITFDGVVCNNVSNPIIIDQYYCDHTKCKTQESAVQIQDITFKNVTGVSKTYVAVKLACSETVPCLNIVAEDIYLLAMDGSRHTRSNCTNVKGTRNGKHVPRITCLKRT